MIEEKKNEFITKATYHKIELSSENFSTEIEIITYYNMASIFHRHIKNTHDSTEEQTIYPKIKLNIKESINKINFSNPNNILEWFYKANYYTNSVDIEDVIVKSLSLLRENHYVVFYEFSRNYHSNNTYDNDLPYYLISQCIIRLEDLVF